MGHKYHGLKIVSIYRSTAWSYVLAVQRPRKKRYWRKAHIRHNADGSTSRVAGHWVNSPGGAGEEVSSPPQFPRQPPPAPRPQPPARGHAVPRPRKKRRKLALAITAAAAITVGAATFTLTKGNSSDVSDSISIQLNFDFKQIVAELQKLGFAGTVRQIGASDSSQDCSQSATGDVRQFLARNLCKEYAVTFAQLHRQGIATQAAISWVVMATPGLAMQYKDLVDKRHNGNPPGQPTSFNGLCYASGQNDDTVWVAQVQPSGHAAVDGQILQAVTPVKLSASYLRIHCVG
jgi:hypothetical protein